MQIGRARGSWAIVTALAVAISIAVPESGEARGTTRSDAAATPAQTATCVGSVGPGIPPPASVPSGIPGFHAHWYGQSGYPTLCPGERSTATVAYYNTGTDGWHQAVMGKSAYLGTWGPEPGQDRISPLGGDGSNGSLATGWPAHNRIAIQPAEWVGPDQVAWFQFTIQAPRTPGYYQLYLRPLIEGATWLEDFGVYWSVTVLNPDGTLPPPPPIGCAADCWPLNGRALSGGPVGRRALNARIDNSPAARPHYGISEADMIFELLVEGQITRLAALFHSADPGTIGSIRSARLSDRYITPMIRGALVYSGATVEETDAIRRDAATGAYYDLNASYVAAGYYRVSTRPSPYNMFTSSSAVREAVNRLGGGGGVAIPRWDFIRRADHAATEGGFGAAQAATALTIPYRTNATVRYEYDAASRTYARWQDTRGTMVREIDAANGVAIRASNVVIIHTEIWETSIIEDIFSSRGLDMNLVGEGPATIFRDGLRLDGRWGRASIYDAFSFYTTVGERIYLSPGQTWVHPIPHSWVVISS